MPRSLEITSTAARFAFSRSRSMGWSRELADASRSITLWISVAYGSAASTLACALVMREVAMSSWALVIFLVEFTDRIRLRSSRKLAMGHPPPSVVLLGKKHRHHVLTSSP